MLGAPGPAGIESARGLLAAARGVKGTATKRKIVVGEPMGRPCRVIGCDTITWLVTSVGVRTER